MEFSSPQSVFFFHNPKHWASEKEMELEKGRWGLDGEDNNMEATNILECSLWQWQSPSYKWFDQVLQLSCKNFKLFHKKHTKDLFTCSSYLEKPKSLPTRGTVSCVTTQGIQAARLAKVTKDRSRDDILSTTHRAEKQIKHWKALHKVYLDWRKCSRSSSFNPLSS